MLCFSACNSGDATKTKNEHEYPILSVFDENTPLVAIEESEYEADSFSLLLMQFFLDVDVPEAVREQFTSAMRGNSEAQEWVYEYARNNDDLAWPVMGTVFNYSLDISENVSLFRIAMLYYNGNDSIRLTQDRSKAFEWAKLSSEKGNASAALHAGDMARYGLGVPVDEQAAYAFYLSAHSIKPDGITMERLGDCYAEGIGTSSNRQKAFDCYFESAMMGYSAGIYKLSDFTEYADMNPIAMYKAASSLSYSGGYWAMAYGGLGGYEADAMKRELIKRLLDIWDSGSDEAASNLKNTRRANGYFPIAFIEALTQTVYAYSYHAFAEEYGLWPNGTYEDAKNIQFVMHDISEPDFDNMEILAGRYLQWDGCIFYEYDFDNDGVDEIGIPMHSGAGGAFMADGFAIYKKNADGFYEYYAQGPSCSLRDAMRIIQYDDRVYFIVNPYDDTGTSPHNILAYTIDENGIGQVASIVNKDYELQKIIAYTSESYDAGYSELYSEVEEQVRNAVLATKQQLVYSTDDETELVHDGGEDWWGKRYYGEVARQDVFIVANIKNDGVEMAMHRGRLISQDKYYYDFNWFQIYENRDFEIGSTPIKEPVFYGEHYGLYSTGNIYDLFPIAGNVIQFWTNEHNGITFCVTLQRYGLLYIVQILKLQDNEVSLVSKALYLDVAKNADILFS